MLSNAKVHTLWLFPLFRFGPFTTICKLSGKLFRSHLLTYENRIYNRYTHTHPKKCNWGNYGCIQAKPKHFGFEQKEGGRENAHSKLHWVMEINFVFTFCFGLYSLHHIDKVNQFNIHNDCTKHNFLFSLANIFQNRFKICWITYAWKWQDQTIKWKDWVEKMNCGEGRIVLSLSRKFFSYVCIGVFEGDSSVYIRSLILFNIRDLARWKRFASEVNNNKGLFELQIIRLYSKTNIMMFSAPDSLSSTPSLLSILFLYPPPPSIRWHTHISHISRVSYNV